MYGGANFFIFFIGVRLLQTYNQQPSTMASIPISQLHFQPLLTTTITTTTVQNKNTSSSISIAIGNTTTRPIRQNQRRSITVKVSTGGGLYSAQQFELTYENVDTVLDDVRPYLIADGGNVDVVSVEDGVVSLKLQGMIIDFNLEYR